MFFYSWTAYLNNVSLCLCVCVCVCVCVCGRWEVGVFLHTCTGIRSLAVPHYCIANQHYKLCYIIQVTQISYRRAPCWLTSLLRPRERSRMKLPTSSHTNRAATTCRNSGNTDVPLIRIIQPTGKTNWQYVLPISRMWYDLWCCSIVGSGITLQSKFVTKLP